MLKILPSTVRDSPEVSFMVNWAGETDSGTCTRNLGTCTRNSGICTRLGILGSHYPIELFTFEIFLKNKPFSGSSAKSVSPHCIMRPRKNNFMKNFFQISYIFTNYLYVVEIIKHDYITYIERI